MLIFISHPGTVFKEFKPHPGKTNQLDITVIEFLVEIYAPG